MRMFTTKPHTIIIMLFIITTFFSYTSLVSSCIEEERIVLLQVKNSSQILNWHEKDCCRWPGITCDRSSSRVVTLAFDDLILLHSGLWALDISLLVGLKELKELYVRGIGDGQIVNTQGMCELEKLRVLSLSDCRLNAFTFPNCMGRLSSLEYLHLVQNEISGNSILAGIGDLRSLQKLYIWRNKFSDDVTLNYLGDFPSLNELELVENELKSPMVNLKGVQDASGEGECGVPTRQFGY